MVNVMGVTVVICRAARAWLARWLCVSTLVACMGQRMATLWAQRVWSTWLTSFSWLPTMGQQLLDSAVQLRRQPREHVLEVGPRVSPVELGRLQQSPNYAEWARFSQDFR